MNQEKKKKQWFSIQGIVLLSVLILLVALLAPPNICCFFGHSYSKSIKAQAYLTATKTAIIQYEIHLGELPWTKGEDKKFSKYSSKSDYNTLCELLTCEDAPDPGVESTANSRKIRFLSAPRDFNKNGWVDPWGSSFIIFLDTDYNGKVNINGKEIKGKVHVYSFGKNKKDDKGEKDDICTWE